MIVVRASGNGFKTDLKPVIVSPCVAYRGSEIARKPVAPSAKVLTLWDFVFEQSGGISVGMVHLQSGFEIVFHAVEATPTSSAVITSLRFLNDVTL